MEANVLIESRLLLQPEARQGMNFRYRGRTAIIAATTAIALLACGESQTPGSQQPAVPKAAEGADEASTEGISIMSLPEQLVFARKDLAEARRVESDAVKVLESRPVAWRSGALGCPEPGMMYTDALVPGVLIRLQIEGEVVVYHARVGGKPFVCPIERAELPIYDESSDQL